MVQTFEVVIEGTAPLLMHNVRRFLDPTDEDGIAFKELGSKRGKTTEDQRLLSEMEFRLGLYLNKDGRPIIPGENLERVIVEGARKSRKGKQAEGGVLECQDGVLEYDGPKTVDGLLALPKYIDKRPVSIQRNRILRTRPRFDEWRALVRITHDAETISKKDVIKSLKDAGRLNGVGDHRPKFGRFEVTEVAKP